MLKRIPLWIVLNYYAFLLDALCVLGGLAGLKCYLQGYSLIAYICLVFCVLVGYAAIVLHSSYPTKRHLFSVLKRRNFRNVHIGSFEEFVDVPCHRLIVRTVLSHLNKGYLYREVMKRYYVLPWKRKHFNDTGFVIFNAQEEYEQWRRNKLLK
jgi:hypothetical protein